MENTIRSWEDLSPAEQDAEIYSDLYKDAYGIRPRDLQSFMALSAGARHAELESLSDEIERQLEEERLNVDDVDFTNRMHHEQEKMHEDMSRQFDDEPYADYGDMREWD